MFRQIKFGHKVTLLGVFFILLTGGSITGVTAYQFRRELYNHEFSGAFTVYMAAANYLSGHYKSKGDRFVRGSLDYVLEQKFLRLEGASSDLITHHPSALVIYDADGRLIYEYAAEGRKKEALKQVPPEFLPTTHEHSYIPSTRILRVAGPISPDGSVPGSVIMLFPSNIEDDVRALYVKSFGVMMIVCVAAIVLSFLFSRRVLAPIEALTRAARRVHDGDMDQRVVVSTRDEIGMLGNTFNLMVSSLVRRIALMHRMQEWTVRISKQFDIDLLYESLCEMFERMAQASFSRLYVEHPPGSGLVLIRERGPSALSPRTGMAQRAHASGLTQYRKPDGSIAPEPGQSVELALPLAVGAKRIGSIHLGVREQGALYDDEMLTTLETLAQHAATSIENALLYRELAEKERFQQEMKWAREIQQSLLPSVVPRVRGYEIYGVSTPAFEVGGDYFDYVPSAGQNWNFVVGDVSGKGVPAALIMSIVRSLIHTYLEFASSPRDVLTRVNRNLSPDLEAEMFVTLAAINLDPDRHVARVVRAGHEPIVVIRASGEIVRLQPRGTALGLAEVAGFDQMLEEMEFAVEPHDTIVMYTDGVTEAQNLQREEFGYVRLEQLAQAHIDRPVEDLVKSIIREVTAFAQGQQQHDDITILVLRRDGTA